MVLCSFCGVDIPKGTGKMYVKKDGKIFYFCSRKCEKNLFKLERVPRETLWTEEFKRFNRKTQKVNKKQSN